MIDRSFHPDFKAEPYWWDAAPPEDASGEALPERVDVLIVAALPVFRPRWKRREPE